MMHVMFLFEAAYGHDTYLSFMLLASVLTPYPSFLPTSYGTKRK
jgi:hypothetical protein